MASGAKGLFRGVFAVALVALFVIAPASAGAATLSAHGRARQVYVVGARAGERLALVNRRGRVVGVRAAGPSVA